jgi:hypothetical protein
MASNNCPFRGLSSPTSSISCFLSYFIYYSHSFYVHFALSSFAHLPASSTSYFFLPWPFLLYFILYLYVYTFILYFTLFFSCTNFPSFLLWLICSILACLLRTAVCRVDGS